MAHDLVRVCAVGTAFSRQKRVEALMSHTRLKDRRQRPGGFAGWQYTQEASDRMMISNTGFGEEPAILQHLMSGGEILASQLPASSSWSPEKKLAGAVLSSALIEVRERSAVSRREVARTLAWINSNDTEWPFSFIRLCHLFGLEPAWVRRVVRGWQRNASNNGRRQCAAYRRAA